MLEIAAFHNGASDLPVISTPDEERATDGTLEEVHASFQRSLVSQVRQGILAEQLGFNYFFMTEHHFQPEGVEFSPNPLLVQAAIAAHTRRIRLGQMANILPWWHPLRLAEQAAMLDVINGGRLEFGIGRGYQPREAEVFGWPYGSTVQDQERNRSYFEEAYEIILKAWSEPSFSHHGQFYSIPPNYTRWNHRGTIAYFKQPKAGRNVDQVLRIGPPDPFAGPSPVLATTTVLRELSVFPQPLQKPHPQIWQPANTERSIRWAARKGINCYFIIEPNHRLKRNIDIYYEEAEKNGWPDRLNRGKFEYGWDADKHRGVVTGRSIHIIRPGKNEKRELERCKAALELQWNYFGPFGVAALLNDPDEPPLDPNARIPAELLINKEIAIVGPPEEVIEKILRIKQVCGYEDFMFGAWFETNGFHSQEVEEQMLIFAEEVMPVLRRECGGSPKQPEVSVDLLPRQAQRV